MNTTIGAIALVGVVLAAPVVISIIAVTASHTGSPQADVDPRGQSRYEHITNPWADDSHGGRFHPRADH